MAWIHFRCPYADMLLEMFILVPRDEVGVFLLGKIYKDEAPDLVSGCIADCSFPEKTPSALKTLAFLARTLWTWPFNDVPDAKPEHTELGPLLSTAALKYLDYGLFQTVLSLLSSQLDPTEVFSQVRLATSNPAFELARISHRYVNRVAEYQPSCCRNSLTRPSLLEYLGVLEISNGCDALTSISADLKSAQQIRDWVTEVASPAYMKRCRVHPVRPRDGIGLLRLIQAYHDTEYFRQTYIPSGNSKLHDDPNLTKSSFAPILVQRQQSSPFFLGAMYQLIRNVPHQDHTSSHPDVSQLWTDLATTAITSLDMTALLTPFSLLPLHAHLLSDFLTRCTTASSLDPEPLLTRLTSHTTLADASINTKFWVPLLKDLLPTHPTHRPLALAILTHFLTNTIGRAPAPNDPPHHRRRPVDCANRCSDCRKLNDFLKSSVHQKWNFKPKTRNRQHFEAEALKGCWECTVQKSGTAVTVVKRPQTYEMRKARWEGKVRGSKEVRRVLGLKGVRDVMVPEFEGIWAGWEAAAATAV